LSYILTIKFNVHPGIASSEEAIIVLSSYYFFNQSKTLGYACPLIGFIINYGKNFVKAFLETGHRKLKKEKHK
jgi:hypothetical protein